MRRAELVIIVAILGTAALAFGIEKMGADAARIIAISVCLGLLILVAIGMVMRVRMKRRRAGEGTPPPP